MINRINFNKMKKHIPFLVVFLAVFIFIDIEYTFAGYLPITESMSNSARIRTQEREMQNLKNQVYQKNYVDPNTSTANLIMEMDQQNKANEKLKDEIKEEMKNENQVKNAVKTITENCNESLGENSKYNQSLKKCECEDGYKLYKDKCIDKLEYGGEYCKETAGINYRYNLDEDNCITNEDYCKKTLGDNSKYLINEDECVCELEFTLTESNCVAEEQPKIKEETRPSIKEKIGRFFNKIKFW